MPSRYMELIWSTATFKPSNSKIWSASVVWFSKAMWYWKPEQPPPTTATRSATGTGVCMFMISLTLVLATGVKLIIASFGLRSQAHLRCSRHRQYSKILRLLHSDPVPVTKRQLVHVSTRLDASHTIGCLYET